MTATNQPAAYSATESKARTESARIDHSREEWEQAAIMLQDQVKGQLAELTRRDMLFQAVTNGISELLNGELVKQALPRALEIITRVAHVDRMVVIEIVPDANGKPLPVIYFAWSAGDHPWSANGDDPLTSIGKTIDRHKTDPTFIEWIKPLRKGKAVVAMRQTAPAPLKNFLSDANANSMLIVPVMVNGKFWGQVAFDDCTSDQDWASEEISALTMFADFVGTAVTRERFLGAVAQRDQLLQAVTASAAEIMTSPYLHEAISKSLETVAKAVRADRMHVLEMASSATGQAQYLLRNTWHAEDVPLELEALLRPAAEASPELAAWNAPLQQGQAIKGTLRTATGGLKDFFERLKLRSTLIVPIMIDGKFWGQIGFDDCLNEREWTATEIDILRTLADLIGTAITRERYVEELGKANTIIQNSPTILFRLRGEPSFPMNYISQNISLFGHDPAELLNSPTLYQSYTHPGDRTKVQAAMVELLRKNAPPSTIEYRMMTSAGESRWVESRYTPVRDTNGRLVEVEGIMIDITERKIADDKIALLARTDPLTALANRATFGDRLRQAFAAAKRGTAPFAVLYLDLDRFKEINDTLGHPVGDKLLQTVADRLRQITRKTDVVARLGGDEFAILQTDVTDSSMASALGTKLVEQIAAPYFIDDKDLRIGVSVGISLYTSDAENPDELLVQADQALYRAKEEGRGQYRFHSKKLDHETRLRSDMAGELKLALENNELELFYQPRKVLTTGKLVGMQANLRWNHPKRGQISSDVFLPLAEKSGVIPVLGKFILDGACKQMAAWRRENVPVPVVSMNVSLTQIKMGRVFVRDVKDSLEKWGLEPGDLELDVTELVLARTALAQSDVLEELRRLGVRIAIDDFGAQYSSLDYLRTYQVSRLKIAKSTLASDADGKDNEAMIRAITSLANELGVEVVADGSEEMGDNLLAGHPASTEGA